MAIARGRPNRHAVPEAGYHSHNAGRLTLAMTGSINVDGEILAVEGEIDVGASAPLAFLRL